MPTNATIHSLVERAERARESVEDCAETLGIPAHGARKRAPRSAFKRAMQRVGEILDDAA